MFYSHEHEFQTLDQLKQAMEDYINYYNTKRIKVKLKGLTLARQEVKPYISLLIPSLFHFSLVVIQYCLSIKTRVRQDQFHHFAS